MCVWVHARIVTNAWFVWCLGLDAAGAHVVWTFASCNTSNSSVNFACLVNWVQIWSQTKSLPFMTVYVSKKLVCSYPSEPQQSVQDFCWSISELLELRLDWICLESETSKTPSTLQACSFFWDSFLEICFRTQTFSPIIFFHMCPAGKCLTFWQNLIHTTPFTLKQLIIQSVLLKTLNSLNSFHWYSSSCCIMSRKFEDKHALEELLQTYHLTPYESHVGRRPLPLIFDLTSLSSPDLTTCRTCNSMSAAWYSRSRF